MTGPRGDEATLPPARGALLRVLVVDDSAPARMLIAEAVERGSSRRGRTLRIVEACDAFEALRLLPREPFDLVLTDVNMPALSGLELIRLIRARPEHRGLPIVVLSTEREEDDVRRAREAGADGYLPKPFGASELDALLAKLLPAAEAT